MKKSANSTAFGLLGCGMAITLTNIYNAGFFNLESTIIVTAFLCGGVSQMITGFLEYKSNNTFNFTTFSAYAIFWFSLVGIIWYFPHDINNNLFGIYMLLWGIFTLFMFLSILKESFVLKFFFFGLTLLYFFSSIGNFLISEILLKVSAYIGIITGLSALYLSIATVINIQYTKEILPIGKNKN